MADTREMTARFRVLLMCVAVASAACGAKGFMDGNRADARARDMAAIQKLREQDAAATLAGDVAAIAELCGAGSLVAIFTSPLSAQPANFTTATLADAQRSRRHIQRRHGVEIG